MALIAGSPFTPVGDFAGPAFAKSEKSKGGGGGGGRDRASGGGGGKSDSAPGRVRGGGKGNGGSVTASTGGSRGNGGGSGRPAHSGKPVAIASVDTSEEEFAPGLKRKQINAALGALNAAHASPQAFANASPNSRVGRIAAYRDAVLAGDALADDLEGARALLDVLPEPTDPAPLFDAKADAEADLTARQLELAALEQALADAGGADETIEAAIADASAALDQATADLAAMQAEIDAALADRAAYDAAAAAVAEAEAALDAQRQAQDDALLAAANKDVTDDVIVELHRLLGLNPPETEEEITGDPVVQ